MFIIKNFDFFNYFYNNIFNKIKLIVIKSMVQNIRYDNSVYCFKFINTEDNIDLKQELLKRYQINDNFNSLLDKLEHKLITFDNFLDEDHIIELKNDEYKVFICKNNVDCKIIDDLERNQEKEYIYEKYNKTYNKIDNLEEVLAFKTNNDFIEFMTFEFYSIFDIINNLDNDLTIIRPYYDKTSDNNTNDLNKYFICADINLVGYNKMLFNKYIKNKDDKKTY